LLTHDVIIIGAGPAGCAAAAQCVRLGLQPLLLDRAGAPGGLVANAWRIENYPGLEPMPGAAFVRHLQAFLARFDIPVQQEHVRALAATADGWIVRGAAHDHAGAHVIVANGTTAHCPRITGLALPAPDAYGEVGPLLRAERAAGQAAILGGGEAACDYAMSLVERGWQVTLLVRAVALRARGRLAHAVHSHPSITVRTGVHLSAATRAVGEQAPWRLHLSGHPALDSASPDRPSSAGAPASTIGDSPAGEDTISADAILVATGRRSAATGLLETAGIERSSGIRTSSPDLLVIGDARSGSLGQIGMAVGDGLAAAVMLGR